MQDKLITNAQYCSEELVTYKKFHEAYQKSFQFNIIIEISFKRRKVTQPIGF